LIFVRRTIYMTLATTSSVWRSTGGDQTRTASAGSMVMKLPFYVANAAATANITASSTSNATVILPAGAVVTSVDITTAGTGAADLGFTPLIGVGPGQTTTTGTAVPKALLDGRSIASRVSVAVGGTGGGSSLGNVANATNLVVVTNTGNTSAAGAYAGIITYFVAASEAENV
jgi:hypothetical protein